MAAVGLAEASRLTGKNVSTIHWAMKAGRLSYAMSATGERQIEVAELERVFGLKFQSSGNLDGGNGAMPGIERNRCGAILRIEAKSRPCIGSSTRRLRRLRIYVQRFARTKLVSMICGIGSTPARPSAGN